jgi:CO/xanthine dehydrogenase Mo-binding subunit
MLFAKLLLSPMPHAKVMRIDARAALAMPGVKAIPVTADKILMALEAGRPMHEALTANV